MNILKNLSFFACLACSILFSTTTMAFSPAPETIEEYQPANWQSSLSAKEDAMNAIEHKDLRLLSFAGKGQNLPGVENEQTKNVREKCGVRYFEEFSDVIRERKELELRKEAKTYAIKYNQTILSSCSLSD